MLGNRLKRNHDFGSGGVTIHSGVQKKSRYGTSGRGLAGVVVLG